MSECVSLYLAEFQPVTMVKVDIPIKLQDLALRAALQEMDLPRLQEQAWRT